MTPVIASHLNPRQAEPAEQFPSRRAHLGIELALAVLSGTACFLACAYFQLSLLAWFALLPLLWVIDHAATLRRALGLAWCAGIVASFGTCDWMMPTLVRFTHVPIWTAAGMHLVFSAYQGTVFVLFSWIVRAGRERWVLPMVAVAPAAMVTAQWAVPFLFPYGLEISQAFRPHAIQIADLMGRYGVTALLLVVNAACYDLATLCGVTAARRKAVGALGGVLVAALIVGLSLGYALVRIRQLDVRLATVPQLQIGVVQPDVAFDSSDTYRHEQNERQLLAAVQHLAKMRQKSRELALQGARLVVWSETSDPFQYPRARSHDFTPADSRVVSAGVGVPLIVGALTYDPDQPLLYNSALAFSATGIIEGRYDKHKLVPFGEYIPSVIDFPWMRDLMQGTGGDLRAGTDPHTLLITNPLGAAPLRLGILICEEDVSPEIIRRVGKGHPDLLINLSNDSWFGVSTEPWQHLAMAVYAAVEQRTSLVRAVNPGASAFIDPVGRVVRSTRVTEPSGTSGPAESAAASLPLLSGGYTVYEGGGHMFADLCVLISTVLVFGALVPRRAARANNDST